MQDKGTVRCQKCQWLYDKKLKVCPHCGAKRKNVALSVCLFIVGIAAIIHGMITFSKFLPSGTSGSSSSSSGVVSADLSDSEITRKDIVLMATDATYKDLLRTPDEYVGEYVVLTVRVQQILDKKYYFAYTDESGYGYYYDNKYCFMDTRLDDDTKLLEDDILTVYGQFVGLKTFQTVLTSLDDEMPVVNMLYVDIEGEDSEDGDVDSDSGLAPLEYRTALKRAQSYNESLHPSKAELYEQLTSEYVGFSEEAAQYAVDNVDADWNENALETAKNYQEYGWSNKEIYNMLISEYGGQFTEEEAQYAIDNLE